MSLKLQVYLIKRKTFPYSVFYSVILSFIVSPYIMSKEKGDYTFWMKYKRFASTEILMYLIMVIGILLGIIIFS